MSSIKSILLHLDATPSSVGRLELALQVAERHDASITALFSASAPRVASSYAYSAGAAIHSLDSEDEAASEVLARDRLRGRLPNEGPAVAWCETHDERIVELAVRESAYADLLVLGQPPQSRVAEGAAPAGFVESVIMSSGKAALVVPRAHPGRSLARRVLVAWNGSPQAARALRASLPLLRTAESVHVIGWSFEPLAGPVSGLSVETYLARHGITATVERRDASTRVTDELVQATIDLQADLVVMGCYGHGRLSEFLLGGATRSALAAMPAVTLMAH